MKRAVLFTKTGWQDYTEVDRKLLSRIQLLIQDIQRNGHEGIGKPEALRGNLSGWWSRRIDQEHRLVYRIKDDKIEIISCQGHYGDH